MNDTNAVYVVTERENIASRFQVLAVFKHFNHAVAHVQSRAFTLCDVNGWHAQIDDITLREVTLPSDFMAACDHAKLTGTRRGIDDLTVAVTNNAVMFTVNGLFVSYEVELQEVK